MGVLKAILVRGISLACVVLTVLFLLVIVLGLTGVSDRILTSMAEQTLLEIQKSLMMKIHDPEALEEAMKVQRKLIYASYGLDKPWYLRIPEMVWRVAIFDLGRTRMIRGFTGSQEISTIILERLPNTILLVTTAVAISAILGIFIGIRIASKPGSILDRISSYLSAISYALPSWWTGIVFILIFAFYLRLFPIGGMYSMPPPTDPLGRILDLIWHSILPILTLVLVMIGGWIYGTRTMVLNIAQEDFVYAARLRGLPEKLVRRRYILRVAAPPIITNLILGLAGSLGGSIMVETVFGWPGMGSLYYQAITSLEEGLIVALTYIYTLIYVIARMILEILYVILDPRVRY
ncbi:MAG: ABC transporter permease [Thaumarchaeota archaeon]|nr:MAG: ABC transporter permease [Nitrososphaerota archaeon]